MTWSAASHYDQIASPNGSKSIALKDRANGPLIEMKRFHNGIKRKLINSYAREALSYLDVCCGRGGDILKLTDAKVKWVHGIDISQMEIAEAKRRVCETRRGTVFTFEVSDAGSWQPSALYDVVSCMFALHYFFENEQSARNIIHMIATSLKPGGVFIGCSPDACALQRFHERAMESQHLTLTIESKWSARRPYGNKYVFDLQDTVTSHGSVEYAVYFDTLVTLMKSEDMMLVDSNMFEPLKGMPGREVSELFRWYVFCKK